MGRPKSGGPDARTELLAAAGRGFRTGGFGGVGVDALAKEAGFTSGAFYAHFGSKAGAFEHALVDGLQALRHGIAHMRATQGPGWLEQFIRFYLGERMRAPLASACALPTLTGDAARADRTTRVAYERELDLIVTEIAEGLGGADARARAWRLLALLSGAAAMAHAVVDETLREELLAGALAAALAI
jgi:AcrR family transcriptional regulator